MDKRLKDKQWRLSHLYKIKDKWGNKIQFIPNSAQAHFDQDKHTRNIILKSRQLGFTTFESVDMLDDTLFNRNFDSLIISYDRESSLKIFDTKIDYAWQNIPKEINELYKVDTDTKNEFKFLFGDGTTSNISVKSSGRSGTHQRVHISEFGKICLKYPDKAKEIITGTIPSVPMHGRVDIESTAEGEGGEFYDMFWGAWNRGTQPLSTEYKAHFYNWSWDDEINSIQNVNQIINQIPKLFRDYRKQFKLSEKEIAYYFIKWLSLNKNWYRLRQEYPTTPEEAFANSMDGAYYSEEIQQAMNEDRICHVQYDKNRYVYPVFDLGGQSKTSDDTAIIFFQVKGEAIRIIDTYKMVGKSFSYYMGYLDELKEEKGYKLKDVWLPWDGKMRGYVSEHNCFDVAHTYGYNPRAIPNINKRDQINSARDNFSRIWFDQRNCNTGKKSLIHSLKSYRKEWNDKLGKYKQEPLHDWSSHFSDAFAYMTIIVDNYTDQNDDYLKEYRKFINS